MSIRGKIPPFPIIGAHFRLSFEGMEDILFTEVNGVEQEIEVVEAPDRTAHSSGIGKHVKLTVKIPGHARASKDAMHGWHEECLGPVSDNYKKTGTLQYYNNQLQPVEEYYVEGAWVCKFMEDQAQMEESSKIHQTEFEIEVDKLTRKKTSSGGILSSLAALFS